MAGKVLKINNMDKIKNSATMNKSAENPATTHTHSRSGTFSSSFIPAINRRNPAV